MSKERAREIIQDKKNIENVNEAIALSNSENVAFERLINRDRKYFVELLDQVMQIMDQLNSFNLSSEDLEELDISHIAGINEDVERYRARLEAFLGSEMDALRDQLREARIMESFQIGVRIIFNYRYVDFAAGETAEITEIIPGDPGDPEDVTMYTLVSERGKTMKIDEEELRDLAIAREIEILHKIDLFPTEDDLEDCWEEITEEGPALGPKRENIFKRIFKGSSGKIIGALIAGLIAYPFFKGESPESGEVPSGPGIEEVAPAPNLAELIPDDFPDSSEQTLINNLEYIEKNGIDTLTINVPQEGSGYSLTRTGDNTVTISYSLEGAESQSNFSLDLDDSGDWIIHEAAPEPVADLVIEQVPASEDLTPEAPDPGLIDRLSAEREGATPPEATHATPEVAPDTDVPGVEPSPEAAPDNYDAVQVDDGSQWRIDRTKGMPSLQYRGPSGGEWQKPPYVIRKMGTNMGALDPINGQIIYLFNMNKDGDFHQIVYPDRDRELKPGESIHLIPDTNLDPAPDGVTGALFDVRHAQPKAVLAQAWGDIYDLGTPPPPDAPVEIAPYVPFHEKYTPPEREHLVDQLAMLDSRIKAMDDFLAANSGQISQTYNSAFIKEYNRLNLRRSEFLISVTNGQAENFRFDNHNDYQEQMQELYEKYKPIKPYPVEKVRDLYEHGEIEKAIKQAQAEFINSNNPEEAEQRLYVLYDLCKQAGGYGHQHSTFRGISQDDIYFLIGRLGSSGYDNNQMRELREKIAKESGGTLKVYIPEERGSFWQELAGSARRTFKQREELTPAQITEIHKKYQQENYDIESYYQELRVMSLEQLREVLTSSRYELIALIDDIDNSTPQEIYNAIERRAAMRAAYNQQLYTLEPEKMRRLDQEGMFADFDFGPGGLGIDLGIRSLPYRLIKPLSKKAFEDPEAWSEIIKILRKEGKYPPRQFIRMEEVF